MVSLLWKCDRVNISNALIQYLINGKAIFKVRLKNSNPKIKSANLALSFRDKIFPLTKHNPI